MHYYASVSIHLSHACIHVQRTTISISWILFRKVRASCKAWESERRPADALVCRGGAASRDCTTRSAPSPPPHRRLRTRASTDLPFARMASDQAKINEYIEKCAAILLRTCGCSIDARGAGSITRNGTRTMNSSTGMSYCPSHSSSSFRSSTSARTTRVCYDCSQRTNGEG
jgi:hypothetical protein